MLLINSISNTKKFLQKTIDNVKSFLTKGNTTYERLPKTPPFQTLPHGRRCSDDKDIETGYKDLDSFYSEFTHQWDSQKGRSRTKPEKKIFHKPTKRMQKLTLAPATKAVEPNEMKTNKTVKNDKCEKENTGYKMKILDSAKYDMIKRSEVCSRSVRERRLSWVAEKLKELEVMGIGNVDHKLDVDEILHYYSRLTCPAFLDIVDKFFTEICSEFYSSQQVK